MVFEIYSSINHCPSYKADWPEYCKFGLLVDGNFLISAGLLCKELADYTVR